MIDGNDRHGAVFQPSPGGISRRAQSFYNSLKKSLKGKPIGKHYLHLTAKLLPLRTACAGGRVPMDSDVQAGEEGEDDGDDSKKKKKPQAFSKYAFTSKMDKLIEELKRCREEDPTCAFDDVKIEANTLHRNKAIRSSLTNHFISYSSQVFCLFTIQIDAAVAERGASASWFSGKKRQAPRKRH
jgi:hypothetical protein